MKARSVISGVVVVAIAAVVLFLSVYVVEEGKQAIVTQFGRPVRFVKDAGLHFKTPLIR